MREKNKLAVGLQLSPSYVMITVYNEKMNEPYTIEDSVSGGESQYQIPMDKEAWEAVADKDRPIEVLADFLGKCLARAYDREDRSEIHLMVTLPGIQSVSVERIAAAAQQLGLPRQHIYVQDYLTSFYHYAINQKRAYWNGDVALIVYVEQQMLGYILHFDRSKQPQLATCVLAARQMVGEQQRDGRSSAAWREEKDRLFFEFLGRLFERRSVVTAYVVGDFFDREWAEKSFQYLCAGRHAFQGMNLFTKGACYGAMVRSGLHERSDILFVGEDIVRENLGLWLYVRGKRTYHPMITAGINWFEAHYECEMISGEEDRLSIMSTSMDDGTQVEHILRLPRFPGRGDRATRLRLTIYFTAPGKAKMEVRDLGFGDLFPSSKKVWEREIML